MNGFGGEKTNGVITYRPVVIYLFVKLAYLTIALFIFRFTGSVKITETGGRVSS